jgi:hypothetical protein
MVEGLHLIRPWLPPLVNDTFMLWVWDSLVIPRQGGFVIVVVRKAGGDEAWFAAVGASGWCRRWW